MTDQSKEDRYAESMDTAITQQPNDSLMVREMAVGTHVKLRGGAIAEVTANPGDGGWLFIRFLEDEREPDKVGTEDMVFCVDVVDVV